MRDKARPVVQTTTNGYGYLGELGRVLESGPVNVPVPVPVPCPCPKSLATQRAVQSMREHGARFSMSAAVVVPLMATGTVCGVCAG
jgi:hypothetical protein